MPTSYGSATPPTGGFNLAVTSQTPSAQRKIEIFPDLYFIRPDLSPLLHLSRTGMFRRISVGDPYFRQFEQPEHTYYVRVNGAVSTTATGITVDSASALKVDDRLAILNGSGGTFRITSISTTRLTGRFYAGATGALEATANHQTVATAVYLQNMGNTSKEGSLLPSIKQPLVGTRDNYVETMRFPFGGTRIRLDSDMWVGRGMDHLAKVEWMTAKKAIEWKLKWQTPSEQTDQTNGVTYRTTGGLYYWIKQQSGQYTDYAGNTIGVSDFMGDLERAFDHGAERKIALCNSRFLRRIDEMKQQYLQIGPPEEIFNLKVRWFSCSQGEVMMIHDRSLDLGASVTAGLSMKGCAFIIDPQYIDYVTFKGNDLHIETGKQQPDFDGTINEYIGDVGLRVNYSQAHSVLYGVA